jgi:plastocyanin
MLLVRSFGVATLAAVLAGALACSKSSSGPSSCTSGGTQVCLVSSAFNPLILTITQGATVTWVNADGVSHTVTSDPGSAEVFDHTFSSGNFTHQFNTKGTYPYHCTIHGGPGTGMHGSIVVN